MLNNVGAARCGDARGSHTPSAMFVRAARILHGATLISPMYGLSAVYTISFTCEGLVRGKTLHYSLLLCQKIERAEGVGAERGVKKGERGRRREKKKKKASH